MAVLSVSASSSCSYFLTSSLSPSSSRPFLPTSANTSKTPFLGFSLGLSKGPWLPTNAAITRLPFNGENGRRSLQVHSQEVSRVPLEQRWMFDESEACGPVCFYYFSPLSMNSYMDSLCLFPEKNVEMGNFYLRILSNILDPGSEYEYMTLTKPLNFNFVELKALKRKRAFEFEFCGIKSNKEKERFDLM